MPKLSKGNGTTRFDWLKDSRMTHGESTGSMNKPKPKNTDDTPKAKVAAVADKTTDMCKTSVKGNSSGGGGRQLSTTSPDRTGGRVKMISGIVGSRKQ